MVSLCLCLQPVFIPWVCCPAAPWWMWLFCAKGLCLQVPAACYPHINSPPFLKQTTLPVYSPGSPSLQHSAPSHAVNKLWSQVGSLAWGALSLALPWQASAILPDSFSISSSGNSVSLVLSHHIALSTTGWYLLNICLTVSYLSSDRSMSCSHQN